jgi:hypothetical protein
MVHPLVVLKTIIIHSQTPTSPFTLASYYQDNMMLQRGPHSAIIWGYANTKSTISTTLFGHFSSTQAKKVPWSSQYIWTLKLRPIYTDQLVDIILSESMGANTKNTLTIKKLYSEISGYVVVKVTCKCLYPRALTAPTR